MRCLDARRAALGGLVLWMTTGCAGTRSTSPAAREAAARPRERATASSRWRFARFDDGLPREGQWRDGFAIADLDGDGHPDVVHGPARKGRRTPTVFRGDGRGHWQAWPALRVPPLPYDYGDVAVGDVDGDGVLDLVLAAHLRGVFVLAGNGDGSFRDASRGLDAPTRVTARVVALADWDGDGRLDVLTVGEGASGAPGATPAGGSGLAIFLNDGPRDWRRVPAGQVVRGPIAASLAFGDLDGDGVLDAVTGSFETGGTDLGYRGRGAAGATRLPLDGVPSTSLIRGVAVADVDGDGRPDAIAAGVTRDATGWYGRLDVLRPGTGMEGPTARPLAVVDERGGFTAIAAGDVDGDGATDLVALTGAAVVPFAGDGRGGFARQRILWPPIPGACTGRHVALADLDGDGRAEIVASFGDEGDGCPSGGALAAWRLE